MSLKSKIAKLEEIAENFDVNEDKIDISVINKEEIVKKIKRYLRGEQTAEDIREREEKARKWEELQAKAASGDAEAQAIIARNQAIIEKIREKLRGGAKNV